MQKPLIFVMSVADAYLVRMKKQEAARAARAVMKLRRPAPVYRQNSMPPASTAMADPPEKAAEICTTRAMPIYNLTYCRCVQLLDVPQFRLIYTLIATNADQQNLSSSQNLKA